MFFKKHYQRILIIVADLLLLPLPFWFKHLSAQMLASGDVCSWTLIGAECGTCGGTRCVSAFLAGDLWQAFLFNHPIFLAILLAIVTVLLLNLWLLFKLKFAKKALRKIYGLFPFLAFMGFWTLYTILRNIPFLIKLTMLLLSYVS